MPALLRTAGLALCEFLLPVCCRVCGRRWSAPPSPRCSGLRWWDTAAVCGDCCGRFVPSPLATDGPPSCFGGRPTDAELAALVAEWKYRGARGAATVLAGLVVAALAAAEAACGRVDALVPVPLHRSRRRERGFNQAELLARLAADGRPVRAGALVRNRRTPQQAKLAGDGEERTRNVAGCFSAETASGPGSLRVALVDDIVTSGATVGAAAEALAAGGWDPVCAVAAGLSARRRTSS